MLIFASLVEAQYCMVFSTFLGSLRFSEIVCLRVGSISLMDEPSEMRTGVSYYRSTEHALARLEAWFLVYEEVGIQQKVLGTTRSTSR